MPLWLTEEDVSSLVTPAEAVPVIEDAAQAHGAEVEGRRAGSFGTGAFSFYPTKNMTTGEGGMVTTDDDAVAERAAPSGSRTRW